LAGVVVVVVVDVAGTAGVCVVVVLVVAGAVEQPVMDTRAAAAMHERINFFIIISVVLIVNLQTMMTPSPGLCHQV